MTSFHLPSSISIPCAAGRGTSEGFPTSEVLTPLTLPQPVGYRQSAMPTAEPDFAQAEEITSEAAKAGSLTPAQAEWIDAFYRNVESRMLNLYDAARLGAWRIYDRKRIADYWQEQTEWFNTQLVHIGRLEENLSALGVPAQPALRSAIQTLTQIVEACRGAYELHA